MHRTNNPSSPKRTSPEKLKNPSSPKRPSIYVNNIEAPSAAEFLQAAEKGDLETVKRYIEAYETIHRAINVTTTNKGLSALSLAAMNGHHEVVKVLLDVAVTEVDAHERHEETALFFAAYSGHANIVAELLAAGAKLRWRKEVLKRVEDNQFLNVTKLLQCHAARMQSLNLFMNECCVNLTRKSIADVLLLSPKRYEFFCDITVGMMRTHMVTQESFDAALARVMQKHPKVAPLEVHQTKEKLRLSLSHEYRSLILRAKRSIETS